MSQVCHETWTSSNEEKPNWWTCSNKHTHKQWQCSYICIIPGLCQEFLKIWILWILLQSKSMEILHYLLVASIRSIHRLHSLNSMWNLISFRNSIPEALRTTNINLALRLIFSAGRIEMLRLLDRIVMTVER